VLLGQILRLRTQNDMVLLGGLNLNALDNSTVEIIPSV